MLVIVIREDKKGRWGQREKREMVNKGHTKRNRGRNKKDTSVRVPRLLPPDLHLSLSRTEGACSTFDPN